MGSGPGNKLGPAQLTAPARAGKKRIKGGLTGGAHRSALKPNRYRGLLPGATGTEARERTGRRAALGELTGAAAAGSEGAWRRREVFSATSSRYGAEGSTGLLGTRGDLRSGRGRRARPRARERGKCCLGGRGWWCESFLPTMAAFYRWEREHEVRGSATRARPVSAEGCGVLWRAAGALAGCGVVWCRGGKEGGAAVVLLAVVGPEQARRQRGMGAGWLGTVGRTWARQRCRDALHKIVSLTLFDSCLPTV
jgi:hypothetical protein